MNITTKTQSTAIGAAGSNDLTAQNAVSQALRSPKEPPTGPHGHPAVAGRYVPASYTLHKSNRFGVVFYQEHPQPIAIAYRGKKTKREWHNSFPGRNGLDTMHRQIDGWLQGLERSMSEKAKAQDARRAYDAREHLKVGDIIVNCWGYEQTNADFYQVISVTRKFCMVRAIASDEQSQPLGMNGTATPRPNEFTGPAEKHGVEPDLYSNKKDRPLINFKYGSGVVWNGKPVPCSWYG